MIEITEAVGLNSIGDHREQKMPPEVSRRWSLKHALPSSM
jgi:hypothetical protein